MTALPRRTEFIPVISVVIPTRNRLPLLRQAVSSVLAQTFRATEVIVVDDASSDATAEWLVQQNRERLTFICLKERSERSAARNRGLEHARGDLVLFLDDDDVLRPSALKMMNAVLASDPEAIAAVGARVLFDERGNRRRQSGSSTRRTIRRGFWVEALGREHPPPSSTLWRTRVIRAIGGWNETMSWDEDWELVLRASRMGPMVFIPQVVVNLRVHSAQWKPQSDSDVDRAVGMRLKEHIESLPPEDRARAIRFLRAYSSWHRARTLYGELHSREAFMQGLRAFWVEPLLLGSPFVRPLIVRTMLKSFFGMLVGPGGIEAMRRSKKWIRRTLGRDAMARKPIRDDVPRVPDSVA